MVDLQENPSKLFSSSYSSEENRDSIDASDSESGGRDEKFYEEIEAPKFVDFTEPDHFRPDDRYWFCLRVGCDQQHLEEIDSEKVYKNFVLRVMAARSPNVRFHKSLRNSSRTPTKCPHSAPPKSTRPRLSRIANISSISEKLADTKNPVVRPLLKPGSTPVAKGRPVAAKYLTTPRNKKCPLNENSFHSVQNSKPTKGDVSKNQGVAKALVFHSPKKAIKVKTSVELRTPITKLCEGINKLEISSQRKRALGSVRTSAKNLSNDNSKGQLTRKKRQSRPEGSLRSQTSINNEARSTGSRKVKGKVSKQNISEKSSRIDHDDSLKPKEGDDNKQELNVPNIVRDLKLEESGQEAKMNDLDLVLPDDAGEKKLSELKKSDGLRSQSSNKEENRDSDNDNDKLNDGMKFTTENCGQSIDNQNENNLSEVQTGCNELMDGDDKENVTASDENRMDDSNQKQNGRKILGNIHDKYALVKKIAQAPDKNLKEGSVSSGPILKFKKPKPTNPKPFRLRTDERGILKEASLEKRAKPQASQSESSNCSSIGGKLQGKHGADIQKGARGQDKSKAEKSLTARIYNSLTTQEPKLSNSSHKSNAIQRLERFRRTVSPIQKQPQGPSPTKNELIPYLIPGQKLEVIPEASPEISEIKKTGKLTTAAIDLPRICRKKLQQ